MRGTHLHSQLLLLSNRSDASKCQHDDTRRPFGRVTPLIAAVREDRRDAVAALLRLGANPRQETLDGVTAIGTAEERGLSETLNQMQNYVASDVAERVLREMEVHATAGRRRVRKRTAPNCCVVLSCSRCDCTLATAAGRDKNASPCCCSARTAGRWSRGERRWPWEWRRKFGK